MAQEILNAVDSWNARCEDLRRFAEIRSDQTLRADKQLLACAYIVFLVASWETFCEDLASESLEFIVRRVEAEALPLSLRKQLAKGLEAESDELAVWKLAGDGWREEAVSRLSSLVELRNRKMNSPRGPQIDQLFNTAIGIESVTSEWKWQSMSAADAAGRLSELVEIRGEIAHRAVTAATYTSDELSAFRNHVGRLVQITVDTVCDYVAELGIEEQFCVEDAVRCQ